MNITNEVNLSELDTGTWTPVANEGEMEMSHFLVKKEDKKVSVVYVEEHVENPAQYAYDGFAIVVHEDAFNYDLKLAKYSLDNITLEQLLTNVIENDENEVGSDLIFNVIYRTDVAQKIYPDFAEISKVVYKLNVSDELEGFLIDHKALVCC